MLDMDRTKLLITEAVYTCIIISQLPFHGRVRGGMNEQKYIHSRGNSHTRIQRQLQDNATVHMSDVVHAAIIAVCKTMFSEASTW